MTVTLRALGTFRRYLGEQRITLELASSATLGDLLERIDELWGATLPRQLWNRERPYLGSAGMAFVDGKLERSLDAPLREGEEVMLLTMGVGG